MYYVILIASTQEPFVGKHLGDVWVERYDPYDNPAIIALVKSPHVLAYRESREPRARQHTEANHRHILR